MVSGASLSRSICRGSKLEPEVGIVTDLTMEINSKIRILCIFAALQYVSSADLWVTSDSIACCS